MAARPKATLKKAETERQDYVRSSRKVQIAGRDWVFIKPGLFQLMRYQYAISASQERNHLSEQERASLLPIERQARVRSRAEKFRDLSAKVEAKTATPEETLESYMEIGGMFTFPDLNELFLKTIYECFPEACEHELSDSVFGKMFIVVTNAIKDDLHGELAGFLGGMQTPGDA